MNFLIKVFATPCACYIYSTSRFRPVAFGALIATCGSAAPYWTHSPRGLSLSSES